jgi:hypothetical protein
LDVPPSSSFIPIDVEAAFQSDEGPNEALFLPGSRIVWHNGGETISQRKLSEVDTIPERTVSVYHGTIQPARVHVPLAERQRDLQVLLWRTMRHTRRAAFIKKELNPRWNQRYAPKWTRICKSVYGSDSERARGKERKLLRAELETEALQAERKKLRSYGGWIYGALTREEDAVLDGAPPRVRQAFDDIFKQPDETPPLVALLLKYVEATYASRAG